MERQNKPKTMLMKMQNDPKTRIMQMKNELKNYDNEHEKGMHKL